MNSIVKLSEFQQLINQFLVRFTDVFPWKKTCKACYYYRHKVYMTKSPFNYDDNLLDYIDIVRLDLSTQYNMDEQYSYVRPMYNSSLFTPTILTSITHLILKYSLYTVSDVDISHLTTLVYLDLGICSDITDDGIMPLVNLRTLLLHNNIKVTSNVLKFLPKLKRLEYSSRSTINIEEIPEHVTNVTRITYYADDDSYSLLSFIEYGLHDRLR